MKPIQATRPELEQPRMPNKMKLTLRHLNLRSTHELDSLIEENILALQARVQIEEASVRLEHLREISPGYRVQVHLTTPGPDVFAGGEDHTIRAAVVKALAELEMKVGDRAERRLRRGLGGLRRPGLRRRSAAGR